MERFVQYLKKKVKKKGFPIVFSKSDSARGRTPEYVLVLVVTWMKLNFDMPFYHPPLLVAYLIKYPQFCALGGARFLKILQTMTYRLEGEGLVER